MVQASHTAVLWLRYRHRGDRRRRDVRAGELRRTDVWRFSGDGRVRHDTMPGFLERFAVAYRQELAAFASAIREGHPPQPGGRDARAALAIAMAARHSLHTGRPVQLDGTGNEV